MDGEMDGRKAGGERWREGWEEGGEVQASSRPFTVTNDGENFFLIMNNLDILFHPQTHTHTTSSTRRPIDKPSSQQAMSLYPQSFTGT